MSDRSGFILQYIHRTFGVRVRLSLVPFLMERHITLFTHVGIFNVPNSLFYLGTDLQYYILFKYISQDFIFLSYNDLSIGTLSFVDINKSQFIGRTGYLLIIDDILLMKLKHHNYSNRKIVYYSTTYFCAVLFSTLCTLESDLIQIFIQR